jgi:hypothetical protein
MVVPNPPRFFREYDEIEFTAKVVNLSKEYAERRVQAGIEKCADGR